MYLQFQFGIYVFKVVYKFCRRLRVHVLDSLLFVITCNIDYRPSSYCFFHFLELFLKISKILRL